MFYDYQKLLSYDAKINFIIGERGVGKSYGAKKYVVNHFIKKNKEFVYIRRYKTELEEALFKDKKPIFFDQIRKEFPDNKLTNTKEVFKVDDKIARLCNTIINIKYIKVSYL